MMDSEKRLRYEVTTQGNCFLHGFAEYQDAVNFCNSLDICVKLVDSFTGVTINWDNR